MARKTLADFNYDYQAYANYLESAELQMMMDMILMQILMETFMNQMTGLKVMVIKMFTMTIIVIKMMIEVKEENGKIHG